MQVAANRIESRAAVRTDLAAIFVSLELSRSKWLITSLSPGGGEKMSKCIVPGGDVPALLGRFEYLAQNGGRQKKSTIAALARKLLMALWKYVNAGVVIEGAVART